MPNTKITLQKKITMQVIAGLLLFGTGGQALAQDYNIELGLSKIDSETEFDGGGSFDVDGQAIGATFYTSPLDSKGPITQGDYLQRVSSIGVALVESDAEDIIETDGDILSLAFYMPTSPIFFEYGKSDIETTINDFDIDPITFQLVPVQFKFKTTTEDIKIGYFLQDNLSVAYQTSEIKLSGDFGSGSGDIDGFVLRNLIPSENNYIGFEFALLDGEGVDITEISFVYSAPGNFEFEFNFIDQSGDGTSADTKAFAFRKALGPTIIFEIGKSFTDLDGADEEDLSLSLLARF